MSIRKRFVIASVLAFVVPVVLILLVSIGIGAAAVINAPQEVAEIFGPIAPGIDRNAAEEYVRPGGTFFSYIIIWVSLAVLILGGTLAGTVFFLSRKIVPPLIELKEAANKIAEGNLDFEVLHSNVPEVNELCVAFDSMRRRLRASVSERLAAERERNLMMANISHDLRTPITSIKGYVEGIRDGVAATPEMRERYLNTIYIKASAMEKMVEQMSDLSELELGRMGFDFKVEDAAQFVAEMLDEFKQELDSETTLEYTPPLGRVKVVMDREKLRRVLANLLGNAVKYRMPGVPLKIEVSGEIRDRGLYIIIRDNGKGISEHDINRVFDTFYRSDLARSGAKGHGLGLAISKQIVERHRGKIWLKSEERVGTEVYIYLPEYNTKP